MSRIGVTNNLAALAAVGQVFHRKRGREFWHYLNAYLMCRIAER